MKNIYKIVSFIFFGGFSLMLGYFLILGLSILVEGIAAWGDKFILTIVDLFDE